jgi:hypothetical protein
MKKIALILTTILIFHVSIHGQTWETIGSGVAEFLLSNPKTTNKMKPEHQVSLSIIGNLLNTSGQRKHELNVADAGRTQMNFNTNSGQQLQLVMDANGSVYALSNGVIYPISQNIVNEAKEYVLNQQPDYMAYVRNNTTPTENQLMLPKFNISNLKSEWEKSPATDFVYIDSDQTLFIADVLNQFNNEIYILHNGQFKHPWDLSQFKNRFTENSIRKNKIRFRSKQGHLSISGTMLAYFLFTKVLKNQIRGTFMSKWVNDLNNNGFYVFDEFQDKRRNFYTNESFLIAAGFYSRHSYYMKLSILDQLTGKTIYTDNLENSGNKFDHGYFSFNSSKFNPGIYVYHISFINSSTNEVLDNVSDKFQILALNQTEKVEEDKIPIIKTESKESSSKAKMINDLIQLLKEGKISEETFKASMKALEKN